MAHSLSAKKRHRQSVRRRERNRAGRTEARSAVRKAREAISGGSEDEAAAAVQAAGAILDRAARKGIIHRNNASRRKSRLARNLRSGGVEAPKKRATRSRSKKS
jgi:small subunit ribosomal protein S20